MCVVVGFSTVSLHVNASYASKNHRKCMKRPGWNRIKRIPSNQTITLQYLRLWGKGIHTVMVQNGWAESDSMHTIVYVCLSVWAHRMMRYMWSTKQNKNKNTTTTTTKRTIEHKTKHVEWETKRSTEWRERNKFPSQNEFVLLFERMNRLLSRYHTKKKNASNLVHSHNHTYVSNGRKKRRRGRGK